VATVGENLLVGAVLVTAILLVFLRNLRAAVIVAAVIPLSLLFAFILMHAMGVSANLISLGAVDFGVIIDSAVVMVEALMVRLAFDAHSEHHGITSPVGRRITPSSRPASSWARRSCSRRPSSSSPSCRSSPSSGSKGASSRRWR
jgi:cobalt-zinc-cadmium resistance protein CzcA